MKMPFSMATSQPKVPDGKVASSLSRRLRSVNEIGNVANKTECLVFLYPSLGLGAQVTNEKGQVSTARGYSVYCPTGQTVGFVSDTNGVGPYSFETNADIATWRIVSQGMRLKLINPDEENDGWFESCRFKIQNHAQKFAHVHNGNTNNLSLDRVLCFDKVTTDELGAMPMVEQPGYQTGLLKELGKSEFRLQPTGCTVAMNQMDKISNIILNTDFAKQTGGECDLYDTAQMRGIIDIAIDNSWDGIMLKLHCRPNTGVGNANGSRLILETIQNVEFCSGPDSDLRTWHTPNTAHPQTDRTADLMNDHPGTVYPRNG